jgi:hypothetical protein
MSRERCRARDGPSTRAPGTPKNRGYFSRSGKPDGRGEPFGYFSAFGKVTRPRGRNRKSARTPKRRLPLDQKQGAFRPKNQTLRCVGIDVPRRIGMHVEIWFRLSASPFCQTPQKEPKSLAPDIRFFASRKIPSLKRSFRGTPRRAIPGPSRLSRHPCRSTPETPLQRGLLNGAVGVCGYFSGRLSSQSQSQSQNQNQNQNQNQSQSQSQNDARALVGAELLRESPAGDG